MALPATTSFAVVAAAWLVSRRPSAVFGVGVDLVEVKTVEEALSSPRSGRYLELVYSAAERRDCKSGGGHDPSRLAARFAAKEAVWKALGEPPATLPWRSVEVVRDAAGRPSARLDGPALAAARRLRMRNLQISLTHEPGYAAAVAVATR